MGISKILSSLWRNISLFLKNSNIKKGLSIFLFFSITILILFSNFNPKQVMLKPDEVAPRDIQSNVNATIIDIKQTEELKKQAAAKVQKVYHEDTYALTSAENDIDLSLHSAMALACGLRTEAFKRESKSSILRYLGLASFFS
jgi:membrane-associated HD superfamily phosphohydrolase